MLKLEPLTNRELEFIQWQIWEPLRRNQDYINEYAKLKAGYFLDPDPVDEFCKKWKLPYHVDTDTEFKDLTNPRVFFWESYKPIYDHAACVDPWHWIIEGKYLKVWVDLESSRNEIEAALKKELDEWRSKWVEFYKKKIKRKIQSRAVKVIGLSSNYLELYINLEAPRNTKKKVSKGYIEPEIKEILTKWLSDWKGNKKTISRLSRAWESCFKVYDMVEKELLPFPSIADILKIKIHTVYSQHKRAWLSIYPDEPYPTKRNRKKEIAFEALKNPCVTCPERETCRKLCLEAEHYANQDFVRSGGVTPIKPENLIDHQEYQRWIKNQEF